MTVLELMHFAYLTGGFTTRSIISRKAPEIIAEASHRGFLSTLAPEGYGNVWRLTALGVHELGLKAPPLKALT